MNAPFGHRPLKGTLHLRTPERREDLLHITLDASAQMLPMTGFALFVDGGTGDTSIWVGPDIREHNATAIAERLEAMARNIRTTWLRQVVKDKPHGGH